MAVITDLILLPEILAVFDVIRAIIDSLPYAIKAVGSVAFIGMILIAVLHSVKG